MDLQRAAERASPDGIPGDELFLDYCHMNWLGYGLMAEAVGKAILAQEHGPTAGLQADSYPSVERLASDLGLTR